MQAYEAEKFIHDDYALSYGRSTLAPTLRSTIEDYMAAARKTLGTRTTHTALPLNPARFHPLPQHRLCQGPIVTDLSIFICIEPTVISLQYVQREFHKFLSLPRINCLKHSHDSMEPVN